MKLYKVETTQIQISLNSKFYESLKNFILLLYVLFVFILIGIIVIEIKHMYNIDIFPNIDTPFDNVYYDKLPSCIDKINY